MHQRSYIHQTSAKVATNRDAWYIIIAQSLRIALGICQPIMTFELVYLYHSFLVVICLVEILKLLFLPYSQACNDLCVLSVKSSFQFHLGT